MTEPYEKTSPTDDGGVVTPPRALDADGDGKPDIKGGGFLDELAPYRKAIVAFLAPAVSVICGALTQGRPPTTAEWLMALGAALATAFVVYQVPNTRLG